MANHAAVLIIVGACILIVLVVAPLRTGAVYLLQKGLPKLIGALKIVLHQVVAAHVNVIKNLQPRQRVLYELKHERTSYTDEK